jgi:ParB-like chromosome segregation protein Spo0J
MKKRLKLSEIITTAGTQIRASLHAPTVNEYAEAMATGVKFPPVIVFHDGEKYILADGFHRLMAAGEQGLVEITADVRTGTKSDALKFALGANAAHGLRRTNADKRRSVEVALAEWPELSNREIARICAVHPDLVGSVRRQLAESASDSAQAANDAEGKECSVPESERGAAGVALNCESAVAANGEQEIPPHSGALAVLENCPAQAPEQTKELLAKVPVDFKAEVKYHLELVRADAEVVLWKINDDWIEPEDLDDCAVELRFAAKKVEALKSYLEWPGIKQNSPLN